ARAAGRAALAARRPPRLAEARYRAALAEDSLTGRAEWKIDNPGPVPARLPLEPLQLALGAAQWADGRPALVGDFGAGSELLVEARGPQTLSLNWSARGLREPGGLRFNLVAPVCPVASFELDLPADLAPSLPRGGLVVPLAAAAGGRRAWRVH